MKPISYVSDQPSEWAEALSAADTLEALCKVADDWQELAGDAVTVITSMTTDDFKAWRKGLAIERRGRFAGEKFAEKFGAVLMPEVLLKVSMMADKFKVPWGLMYLRLKESGRLAEVLA